MTTTAVDNDVLHKGAGYGLLTEMLGAIPARMHEVGILGSAKYVVARKLRKAKLTEALALLDQVVRQVQCLEPTEEEARFAAQLEYESQRENLSFDSGESMLCAIVIERSFEWLVTGDKKAIKSLEKLMSARGNTEKLAGRVVCLEQLMLRLIQGDRAPAIRSAICARPNLDKALTCCFSCGNQEGNPKSWAEGLMSYVQDVRAEAPSLLAP